MDTPNNIQSLFKERSVLLPSIDVALLHGSRVVQSNKQQHQQKSEAEGEKGNYSNTQQKSDRLRMEICHLPCVLQSHARAEAAGCSQHPPPAACCLQQQLQASCCKPSSAAVTRAPHPSGLASAMSGPKPQTCLHKGRSSSDWPSTGASMRLLISSATDSSSGHCSPHMVSVMQQQQQQQRRL